MWLCLNMFEALDLLQQPSFLLTTTMQPTLSAQRSTITSLLLERYSLRQIQSKTGLGKSTVARIKKEVNQNKVNSKEGHSSKLTFYDKQCIMHQITTGRLDNAVEATKFINNIIPNLVSPQTVRNVLKENNFRSVVKKKCPPLKKQHWINRLQFAKYYENWTVEDWKRVLWSDETKINRIGSDGRVYTWKQKGEQLSDRTTTPTVKHGGGNNLIVWGCMG